MTRKEGDKGEKIVKDILTSRGFDFIKSSGEGDYHKYDLMFKKKNKIFTFEVKHQPLAGTNYKSVSVEFAECKPTDYNHDKPRVEVARDKDTGYFVEKTCYPTGVDVCLADYYVFITSYHVYFIESHYLKEKKLLKRGKYVWGGNDNTSLQYTLSLHELKQMSEIYFDNPIVKERMEMLRNI